MGRRKAVVALLLTSMLASAPAPAAPDEADAFLMTPEERARIRLFEGRSTDRLRDSTAVSDSLDRVFGDVAGSLRHRDQSFLQSFRTSSTNPGRIELEAERFLVGEACKHRSCGDKSSFVIDLSSGHVAMAVAEERRGIMLVHKDCANPELVAQAERLLGTWGRRALKSGRPDFPRGAAIERRTTPCVPTAAAAPTRKPGETVKVHPLELPVPTTLSEAERLDLRQMDGVPWKQLRGDTAARQTVGRIIDQIAGRGYYRQFQSSRSWVFSAFFAVPELAEPARIEDGRYLIVAGCIQDRCLSGSMMIVDLDSGHVAAGILHELDAAGVAYHEFGHLTLFVRRCAGEAFKEFARSHFAGWGRQRLLERHGPALPGTPDPDLREAACGA